MRTSTYPFRPAIGLAICCVVLATPVFSQSSTRSLTASPKPQGANPFLPFVGHDTQLPVMIKGFCIVTLREQQEWLQGSESHQLIFDGQLYWFASQRQRAMFAAKPQRYVPALGGNCVVTLAESGVRKQGEPQFGILHDQRLFFFRGASELEEFRVNPTQYDKLDMANSGFCLVSQTDKKKQLPGLPATTTIVNGFRYQFAGIHQQQKFLLNMEHYGVAVPHQSYQQKIVSSPPPLLTPSRFSKPSPVKKKKPKAKATIAEIKNKAMGGYCPVSIRNQRTWVAGSAKYQVKFDGLTYLLAGESEQKLFLKDPTPYLPALGGHCVVTEIDENRRVSGSIYHAAQHEVEDRMFLFAGPEQKLAFNENPEKYLQADLAAGGKCMVSLVDEGTEVAGRPDLLTWHRNKRYLFASEAHQEKFFENTERYQDQ